jgi:hypothetical protein
MADEKPVSLFGTVRIWIEVQGKEQEFQLQISPPAMMASAEELEIALKNNREILADSAKEMVENLKKDYFEQLPPWKLNYDGPIQNALMARLNINVLIPLINIKGGHAKYTKQESWPVKKHIEWLQNKKGQKAALESQIEKAAPFSYAFALSMLVAVFVILYITID